METQLKKLTKATDITSRVKSAVWERDGHKCIVCGNTCAAPSAHYIRRSHGGLGIPENVVTLCMDCHREFDEGGIHGDNIKRYLQRLYPDWDEKNLVYRKPGQGYGV
jgi:5-methylcytosine-specific restriction endonuclease McrA